MHRQRSNWKAIQDLELRLGPCSPPKGVNILSTNFGRGIPDLIDIEDDDDDVQIFSPMSSTERLRFFPRVSSWVPVISDEDLELRLGLRAHNEFSGNPSSPIYMLDDGVEDPSLAWKCFKKKFRQASSGNRLMEEQEEVKLRCSICMDTMKEETSTVCGHVFCKPCISNAICLQKKCPTCRENLSLTSIHRIYLPGATS
ncbi:uncharacterized protein LOC143861700 isoform X2 [Tasmannia lanceolata]|uniref:uncharacterized protein LOC143861700 isoform X2 n=1 Tax=Tasmannia lanceolata TaxID=3420 RepID=UPI0040629B63